MYVLIIKSFPLSDNKAIKFYWCISTDSYSNGKWADIGQK